MLRLAKRGEAERSRNAGMRVLLPSTLDPLITRTRWTLPMLNLSNYLTYSGVLDSIAMLAIALKMWNQTSSRVDQDGRIIEVERGINESLYHIEK